MLAFFFQITIIYKNKEFSYNVFFSCENCMIFTFHILFFIFFDSLLFIKYHWNGNWVGRRSSYSRCTQFIKYNKYISAIKISYKTTKKRKHLLDYQFN